MENTCQSQCVLSNSHRRRVVEWYFLQNAYSKTPWKPEWFKPGQNGISFLVDLQMTCCPPRYPLFRPSQ